MIQGAVQIGNSRVKQRQGKVESSESSSVAVATMVDVHPPWKVSVSHAESQSFAERGREAWGKIVRMGGSYHVGSEPA